MRIVEPIEGHQLTTMRMGGPLRRLIETDQPEELTDWIKRMRTDRVPFVFIGSGSNIILPPQAKTLSVIRYTASGISRGNDEFVTVDSGCSIARLMGWCFQNNRSGLEFLIGIPGTVGGALAVNAGAFGKSIGTYLISAQILDAHGQLHTWSTEDFSFTYRSSRIKYGSEMILSATIKTSQSIGENTRQQMCDYIRYRSTHHPSVAPSAGCFFKNPKPGQDGISAGRLIDSCGLKGYSHGGLQISPRHANFIINRDHATLDQLVELTLFIQKQVRAKTGITLEREVIWIHPDGRKY